MTANGWPLHAAVVEAFTLAQFLLSLDRYDPRTGRYLITGEANLAP
jgi:hypothetical protein